MKAVYCFVIMLICCILSMELHAQKTVTGMVTDKETGEGLIGATVAVVDFPTVGAITDIDGSFSVKIPEGANQLQFSYTGYQTVTKEINESDVINVALQSGSVLDEIVVVGYGTQRIKEVTGAVTNIKSEDFNKGNVSDPTQLLQGKVAGLSIAKPGGDPNGSFQVRLRGLSTFGDNTSPLVVIDGVIGASLETVDPQDIESIDVLKDGSAASIYGTRGASGVILISTKKGRAGQTEISYNGYVSREMVANKLDVLTAKEYITLPSTTDFEHTTDWFNAITRDALTHSHNLSASGGNEKSTYRVSFNYRDGEGVALKTGFDQLNGRIRFTQYALNDRLTLNFNLSSTIRNEEIGTPAANAFATRYNPTAPIYENDENAQAWGGYFQRDAFGFFNPVAAIEQHENDATKKRILGNIRADYEVIQGLKLSIFYNQSRENDLFGEYWSKQAFWTPFGVKNDKGFGSRKSDERFSQLFETTGNLETNIWKLNTKLLGGYSYQEFINEGFGSSAGDFLSDGFGYHNLGSSSEITEGKASIYSYKNKSKLIAFFGRLNLNYDDFVFITASMRREGSTKFGVNNKWGWFPGVSGGIDLSRLINLELVNSLKFRAGYGVTGNTPGPTNLSLLRFGAQGSRYYNDGQYVQAFGPISNPNPDLKWERKRDLNFGLDFTLLNYKLSGSIEYYQTQTDDLILDFPVRVPPNLFGTSFLNLGEMKNSGLEFTASYFAINQPNFTWKPTLAVTYFLNNELVKISGPEVESEGFRLLGGLGAPFLTGVNTIKIEEGQPIGQIVGPIYTGIDEDGKLSYEDIDGDGRFKSNDDIRVIGNGLPDYQFGLNNTFTLGNFDANIFVRAVIGHDLLNVNNARYGIPAAVAIQNGMAQALDFLGASNGPVFSDVHVENASFLRLDNVTLGYTFDLPEKSGFKNLRLYATGQNLYTLTNYSGVDPEVRYVDDPDGFGFGNPLAPGIDRENTYVFSRGFTFGINVGL